ncbi:MAG: LacI family DNA-binding transcriptional regulator [Clostridia bacterium]|nr:LacI family DNA-binding transcriptional regulator [Clostridia bacterium]
MGKKVTLEDIARAAGVSKNTVSTVLRNRPGASEAVRRRILSLAQEMGYSRAQSGAAHPVSDTAMRYLLLLFPEALGLHARYTPGVGLIPRLYFHMQHIAQERGCIAITYLLRPDEEKSGILPPVLNEMRFTGIATFGSISPEYISLLTQRGYHVVTVHEHVEGLQVDAVIMDDVYAGYVMTKHLIQMGHTRIAYLGEKYYLSKYMDRWEGYCRAMIEHKLPIRQNAYSEIRLRVQENPNELLRLHESLSVMDPMPTAIVCGEDFTASRVRTVLGQLGYRVPEDISLVGFDDVYGSDYGNFPITTYYADYIEIAKTALDLLLQPDRKPRKVIIYGEPIFRSSVRRLTDG